MRKTITNGRMCFMLHTYIIIWLDEIFIQSNKTILEKLQINIETHFCKKLISCIISTLSLVCSHFSCDKYCNKSVWYRLLQMQTPQQMEIKNREKIGENSISVCIMYFLRGSHKRIA